MWNSCYMILYSFICRFVCTYVLTPTGKHTCIWECTCILSHTQTWIQCVLLHVHAFLPAVNIALYSLHRWRLQLSRCNSAFCIFTSKTCLTVAHQCHSSDPYHGFFLFDWPCVCVNVLLVNMRIQGCVLASYLGFLPVWRCTSLSLATKKITCIHIDTVCQWCTHLSPSGQAYMNCASRATCCHDTACYHLFFQLCILSFIYIHFNLFFMMIIVW